MAKLDSAPKGQHGGRRHGAGRPPGAKNVLPQGTVAAIKSAGLRVPKDAPKAHRDLADRALQRMADVLEGGVQDSYSVLSAARALREEVCGGIPKPVELTGKGGTPLTVTVNVLPPEES